MDLHICVRQIPGQTESDWYLPFDTHTLTWGNEHINQNVFSNHHYHLPRCKFLCLVLYLSVYVFVYLCLTLWANQRDLKFGEPSRVGRNWFFFFGKNDPDGNWRLKFDREYSILQTNNVNAHYNRKTTWYHLSWRTSIFRSGIIFFHVINSIHLERWN